jgi:serine/threonine-protein kinase
VIAVGTVLHDTYRVEGQIGRGAMGVVFRVSHMRLPRDFAVKVLGSHIRDDDTAFSRFRREAEISSRLGHPNIVEVFDFNRTEDGQAYFVMELLDGHDLATELKQKSRMAPARVLEVLSPVASALSAAHAAGVIHRDLKPSNIFLGRKGTQEVIKVLDFGVSKILGALDLTTQSEALVGTPVYMSPEQAQPGGAQNVDARSDQFSLASIAYELLSGRRAFGAPGDMPYLALYKVVNQEPLPIAELAPAIQQVLSRALAKAPDERFPDVAAFIDALERAVASPDGPISLPATPRRARVARRRLWMAGLGAGGLALAGVLVAVVPRPHRAPPPTPKPLIPTPQPQDPKPALRPPPPPLQTEWSLVIKPENARVVLRTADGTTRTLPGPWSAAAARVVRWTAAERPQQVRAEADGYDALELPLPTEGTRTAASVSLIRRRAPASPSPKHRDLSYPWQ